MPPRQNSSAPKGLFFVSIPFRINVTLTAKKRPNYYLQGRHSKPIHFSFQKILVPGIIAGNFLFKFTNRMSPGISPRRLDRIFQRNSQHPFMAARCWLSSFSNNLLFHFKTKVPFMTNKQRQRQLYRIGRGWFGSGQCLNLRHLLPGYTTPRQTLLSIGRAEHWLHQRRAAGLPVRDQMNAEKPDDVLSDLDAKHGCAAPTGLAACVQQWRDIQKRKRDFALEAKHRGQDIAANIAMQVSNAYGYCADRLEYEMAANE